MSRLFYIIGVGSGQASDLTGEALQALAGCGLLLSTGRLAESLAGLGEVQSCPAGQLAATALQAKAGQVGILVSGDAGFFSAAKGLRQALAPAGEVRVVCGLSSMQLLCAELGVSYDGVHWLSLHGREGSLLGAVSYHPKVFALTGGTQNAQALCRSLETAGLGGVQVTLGENLGAPDARIRTASAAELAKSPCGSLAVLLVQNDHTGQAGRPVFDHDMERGNVPMTKQEARWTAVNLLDLRRDDVVYDVGAGTGSVSMEISRRTPDGLVFAIERNIEGVALIERNRRALGCWNVQVVEGEAPAALDGLPAPNAAFIGGSGGALYDTLSALKARNPQLRVVISAVSLETLHDAQTALDRLGFEQTRILQLTSARGTKADGKLPLQMNNPIYLLSGGPKR